MGRSRGKKARARAKIKENDVKFGKDAVTMRQEWIK